MADTDKSFAIFTGVVCLVCSFCGEERERPESTEKK
jgi:hypothetical protein